MTDGGPRWTVQQKLAIEAMDRDVLVTASAGAGKTAVLAQRCVRILTDPVVGVDVNRILVMTFTEAAAEEMRSRIAGKLRERFAVTRDARLRHQLLMIDAADISTIHAFCKRLITEHFYRLGIDPAFRILEPDEQLLLKSDILRHIVEQAWADPVLAPGLAALLDRRNIGEGRGDFLNHVISISNFLDSLPARSTFFERARALADIVFSVSDELAGAQRKIILGKLGECQSMLRYAQRLDRQLAGGHWSDQIQTDLLGPVALCIDRLEGGDVAACADILLDFQMPKFKNKPRDLAGETADKVKAPAKKAMEAFKDLRDLAVISPDYAEIVCGASHLQTKVLIELVQRFDRSFAEAKRQANCLDFADLEQLALRLLTENTDIARKVRDRFKHIFVDEYQDINALQQAVIDRIASGDNVFAVGDIKQSIYGFRQSKPEIFLARLTGAVEDLDTQGGAFRVDLGHNFRSRKGILDFANALFSRIMKSSIAAIDYDERALLMPGFEYRPLDAAAGSLVEMAILDEDGGEEEGDTDTDSLTQIITASQRQAAFIASRIRSMVGANTGVAEFEIYDRAADAYRPVQYGDIVILMRSLAHTANDYVEILRLAGVPVNSQSCAGYFAATEITDCICLLKILDNPRQDIEFAAVLRSPLFRITDSQLAEISAHTGVEDRTAGFCDRVTRYADDGPDASLRRTLRETLDCLARWRIVIARQSLADLFQAIFAETDYVAFVSALPNGKQRKANLYKLHDRAIQFAGFAASRTASPGRFVEYIEKLLERGEDWAPAAAETSADNAVRLMSIHKSKGLEFPVVFLAETNRRFNHRDAWSDCLVDDPETIGLRIIEPHSKVKLSSLAHQVISEKKHAMTIAEEMRLLYVAVTRARERLVVTASRTARQCTGILTDCAIMGDEPLCDWQIKSAQCHFDWLLYAFGGHRRLLAPFAIEGGDGEMYGDLFRVAVVDRDRLDRLSTAIITKKQHAGQTSAADVLGPVSEEAAGLVEQITASVTWKYPWADVTGICAKQSVSELTHRDDEWAALNLSAAFHRRPTVLSEPHNGARGGVDPRVLGSAAHLVLESLDLSAPVTVDTIRQTAARLVTADRMAAHVAAAVDPDAILGFFSSDLGRVVLDNPAGVLREWPFTIAVDACKLGAVSTGESVIVQGIVDMLVGTDAGLIVIDFKTDSVDAAGIEERTKRYRTQVAYYAYAARAILRRPVVSAWLYYLACGRAVAIAL
ncbi:MAG: helicase-exonuclease AddAB subunit AddA [Phycisphaerae bacterium]|nr:helicase-exonuclease AddAB subunit AddA [Phycisphaerae bacterium]